METCDYEAVDITADNNKHSNDAFPRKYLLRQILVCSGVFMANFCYGLSFGSPTVLISQLRQEANSSDAVNTEMASWLSCTINYSGTVNSIILAILSRLIGRKLSFLFISITSVLGFIFFYFSTNTTHILISQILHGTLAGTPLTVSTMVLTEYISPQYRGVFLALRAAIFLWGVWIANTIGTFFHWKKIGILAILCSTYTLLTTLLWPESPYWLVNKDRFEDCAISHRWLKGCSEKSEAELEKLILLQQQKNCVHRPRKNLIISIGKMFRSNTFYKPLLLALLLESLYHFTGKMACGMYAMDITKRITRTEKSAYTVMLILDGITVLGTYVGCSLCKIFKRRFLLIVTSPTGVTFLFSMSFYLYLIHHEVIVEYTIVSILLLIGYSLAISVGPLVMCNTVIGELVPVKYRSSSVLIVSCFANFLMATIMRIAPFVIDYCGVRGLFICFGVLETLFIVIVYKVLPETKDKTILEIQETLLGTKAETNTKDCLVDSKQQHHNNM